MHRLGRAVIAAARSATGQNWPAISLDFDISDVGFRLERRKAANAAVRWWSHASGPTVLKPTQLRR
jgi:hypothetical protein